MTESILEECVIEETSDDFQYLLNVGDDGLPGDFMFEEVITPVENQNDTAITDDCSLSENGSCDEKRTIKSEPENPVCGQDQVKPRPCNNIKEIKNEPGLIEESEEAVTHSEPLLSCSDIEFKTAFRVSRSSFEKILKILSKEKLEEVENVPLLKRLLIFLWLMGSFSSFNDAAEALNVTEDEASDSFYSVCAALSNKTDSFVQWPDSDEREVISSRVEDSYGIDGVVGILAVHYCPLYIPKESETRRSYFNVSMKLYCVALQLVIDDEFLIRDVFVGQPGSLRQDMVMRMSPLAAELSSSPCALVENHKHVLARAGLPQLQTTLTPLVGSNLSPAEIRLNQKIESACCLADEAYQTIRLRFPILTLLDINEAVGILQAACVLHNICLRNGDEWTE